VATHTLREAPSPQEFAQSFGGRLRALGHAHELVSREGWGDVPLHDLLAKELEPYTTVPGRVSTEGPPLRLAPKVALALGMAVHELATNAAKYGALSAEGGRVLVAWSVEGKGPGAQLLLRWREADGPRVQAPVRRGFGSSLIERQLRHDLHGGIELEFREEGLRATLTVPLAPGQIAAESGAMSAAD
jgi:two-component system, chemotaxis family, CheB/CheR fusion protein